MRKQNFKKFTSKKKGLTMTDDMIENPENYRSRVCVAYDRNGLAHPRMYVLVGNHDISNEHDIRKLFAQTSKTNYYDARVILYDTYVKRIKKSKDNGFNSSEIEQIAK